MWGLNLGLRPNPLRLFALGAQPLGAWPLAPAICAGAQHCGLMRYRAEDFGLQPNCDTFSLYEQRRSTQKENTPGCVAQPGGWVPCASHHLSAASIDILVERRSLRRPWRYAREMAAMLGHANGTKVKSKSSRQVANRVCAQRTITFS
jgi:hypothetical protein